jgi:hypothetical protein
MFAITFKQNVAENKQKIKVSLKTDRIELVKHIDSMSER